MSLEKNESGGLSKNDNYSEGSPYQKISIVGDDPIDIHRRVVHT